MSTREVASLIQSVNELTGTVAGKMKEIDSKVAETTTIVENTIQKKAYKTFYIDQKNGDDKAIGSRGEPLKSIHEVARRVIPGGRYNVRLLDHYRMDPDLDDGKWSFQPLACTIIIHGDGGRKDFTFVTHARYLSWEGATRNVSSRIDTTAGPTLVLNEIRLRLDNSGYDAGYSTYKRTTFFSTNAGFSESPNLNMRFYKCDFTQVLAEMLMISMYWKKPITLLLWWVKVAPIPVIRRNWPSWYGMLSSPIR